jgi:DNA/RNA-binding domain of Phe-tRNA-synthetase-like protein
MKFSIDSTIIDKYPSLVLGLLVVRGIDNSKKSSEVLDLLAAEQEEIRKSFAIESYAENSKIQVWRDAYKSFGAKVKKYKCSIDNLFRMTLNDIDLTHISTIVDIYNYISLKHIVPVGGDDMDKVEGDVVLTVANGTESFVQLNTTDVKNPKEGEVVYRDSKEVLCRRWNWRECDKSKMTQDSKNVTLVVEALNLSPKEVKDILDELSSLVTKYCGGEVREFVLDKGTLEVEF